MDKRTTWKRIGSLFLTLAMVLTMTVTALPVYAAAGGTINLKYNPEVPGLDDASNKTQFTVYKVGTFNGPNLEPIQGITSVTAEQLKKIGDPEAEQDEAWRTAWLDAASNMADEAPQIEGITKYGPTSIAASENAQPVATVDSNGLYLIVGNEVQVGDEYWKPSPVLVMVLNGDTTYTFDSAHVDINAAEGVTPKITSRAVVYNHSVTKAWDHKDNKQAPKSVKIGIYYGDGNLIDTVTLNEETGWTYEWSTTAARGIKYSSTSGIKTDLNPTGDQNFTYDLSDEQAEPEDETPTWEAIEIEDPENTLLYNYYKAEPGDWQEMGDGISESKTITNTFEPVELTINKTLTSYGTMSDTSMNATVVFEIRGYRGDEVVYRTNAGITFTGTGSGSTVVKNIPLHLDKLEVEEVYSTNYTETSGSMIRTFGGKNEAGEAIAIVGKYTADFTNSFDTEEPPTYSGGIVNKYDNKSGTYKYTQTPAIGQ